MKLKHLAQAATLATLGFAGTALADHDDYDDRRYRTVASSSGYANGPSRARFDYAKVISAQPIVRYVDVKTPVRECWEETRYHTVDRNAGERRASTFLGAVIGGVVGHQIGSGRGNDAATVAGTLIGAAIGNESARERHGYDKEQVARLRQNGAID